MKTFQLVFTTLITLFTINIATAQYGGYGNGYGNGYGMNRSMSQMNQSTPDKPREIPAEETAAQVMEQLKPELKLDALQEIAIKNTLIESIKSQTAIIKSEKFSQSEKGEEIKALREITDRKIKDFLSEDQKAKYLAFIEKSKNPKNLKKSKKSKKDTTDNTEN